MASVLRVLALLLVVYIVVTVLAWRYQERLAFPGPRMRLPTPAERRIPDGERVAIRTSDSLTLYGWYLPPRPLPAAGQRAPALIWFYGNMETVSALATLIDAMRPAGMGLLIVDYRGYGESEGSPTEAGVYRDAEAAWQFLMSRTEIDSARIAIYGRSIGAAVALYLATARPARVVVLDSPFSSGRAMAVHHYWFLPRFIVRLGLDNVARAGQLRAPLLIFHGVNDAIVPIAMGRAVAKAGRAEAMVEIPNAGHNDTYGAGAAAYRDTFHRFLEKHLR